MSQEAECDDIFEQTQYEVEAIINRKIDNNDNYFYYVKWVDYPMDQCTWEPINHLLGNKGVQRMIEQCDRKLEKITTNQWKSQIVEQPTIDFQKKQQSEKALEKNSKNQWKNGLQSWANFKTKSYGNDQNVNRQNLNKQVQVIDLQQSGFQVVESRKSKNDKNHINIVGVKRKITQGPSNQEEYPFYSNSCQKKRHYLSKKIKEILKVQQRNGQLQCLVKVKVPENQQGWMVLNLIRVLEPFMLEQFYQKLSQKVQKV